METPFAIYAEKIKSIDDPFLSIPFSNSKSMLPPSLPFFYSINYTKELTRGHRCHIPAASEGNVFFSFLLCFFHISLPSTPQFFFLPPDKMNSQTAEQKVLFVPISSGKFHQKLSLIQPHTYRNSF